MHPSEAHPYARLFPMLGEAELQALADDITANGLKSPIIIDDENRVIDGRNREAACILAGIEPVYEPFVGTEAEILKLVISMNVHRRHLTESQRAMIAASVANVPKHVHRPKESDGQVCPSGVTVDEAAELCAVSPRSVKTARKVQSKGVPELQAAVTDGAVSVSAAASIAEKAPEDQREVVAHAGTKEKPPRQPPHGKVKVRPAFNKKKAEAAVRKVVSYLTRADAITVLLKIANDLRPEPTAESASALAQALDDLEAESSGPTGDGQHLRQILWRLRSATAPYLGKEPERGMPAA